jgi:hypothetical protein
MGRGEIMEKFVEKFIRDVLKTYEYAHAEKRHHNGSRRSDTTIRMNWIKIDPV